MIIVTFSNWRRKLKVLFVVLALLIIVALVSSYLLGMSEKASTSMDLDSKDRSPSGSLKVNVTTEKNAEEQEASWWGQFIETLKGYYQE